MNSFEFCSNQYHLDKNLIPNYTNFYLSYISSSDIYINSLDFQYITTVTHLYDYLQINDLKQIKNYF